MSQKYFLSKLVSSSCSTLSHTVTFSLCVVQFQFPTNSLIMIYIKNIETLGHCSNASFFFLPPFPHYRCLALSSPSIFSSSSSPPLRPLTAAMMLMMTYIRRRTLTWGLSHWFWWRSTAWFWSLWGRSSAACRLTSWVGMRRF